MKEKDDRRRVTLLMSESLNRKLKKKAKQKGISLNEYILLLLGAEETKPQ